MKALVVVDMQNDFIDGALGTREAVGILEAVRKEIDRYRENGDLIFYTRDTHQENYLETQEGKKLPVVHCLKGTPGWQIAEGLYVEGCPIIDKPTFGSVELAERIAKVCGEEGMLESVELIGLCTDICVISNAMVLKAGIPELPVTVKASCCAGVTPQSHENALEAMKMCQIDVIE